MPRIVLIHAVRVAIDPVAAAFAHAWPQAELVNLLDDGLSADRAREEGLSPAMVERFESLANYAVAIGADAILFTCSAFGPAIERVQRRSSLPVLKPNEAMFEAALDHGRRLGMLLTFEPSRASMAAEFQALAAARSIAAALECEVVPEAMRALAAGRADEHHALLAEAAARFDGCDALMLAQFSMAPARDIVGERVRCPVLTSPDAAVARLRGALGDPSPGSAPAPADG